MEKKINNLLKVVITGAECSGKSVLTQQLATYFNEPFVLEYARIYLDTLNHPYTIDDLPIIARGQLNQENGILSKASHFLFCDTDLLTIKIWSEYKYGKCDDFISNELSQNLPHLYLLCKPDIPWEFHEQRENPNDRDKIFALYESEIIKSGTPYAVISGLGVKRFSNGLEAIFSTFPEVRKAK